MKISYDPDVDAMTIVFQKGKYEVSKEMLDGIIVDYTPDGKILAIEILDVSTRMPTKTIGDITLSVPVAT